MRRSAVVVVTAASAPLRCEAGIDVRPWQLCGNGRNDWSTKLIRGLVTEAATGFQSRRGRCREPTPVTPHYAPFPTYKAAGAPRSDRGGGMACCSTCAAAGEASDWISQQRAAYPV